MKAPSVTSPKKQIPSSNTFSRRSALKTIGMASAAFVLPAAVQAKLKKLPKSIKLGIITDTHIGFVKDAPERLDVFLDSMKAVKPDVLVQMGDFANPNEKHQPIVDKFNASHENVIHAIGNHELDHGLTREDAKKSWGMPHFYYSKKVEGIKIIVLDGNDKDSPTYKSHGGYHSYIGDEQRAWLKKELKNSELPVLLVSHQPLAGPGAVDNAEQMQNLLQPFKEKIILSINGHTHLDYHVEVEGINYLHINSASYYWMGGKVKVARYKKSLFTTMELNPANGTVSIQGSDSEWENGTPEDANYFANGKKAEVKEFVKPRISERKFENIKPLSN